MCRNRTREEDLIPTILEKMVWNRQSSGHVNNALSHGHSSCEKQNETPKRDILHIMKCDMIKHEANTLN